MKTITILLSEEPEKVGRRNETISVQRVTEIMKEEGIEYSDEELTEVLQFLSKVILITTANYERTKEKEAKVINLNTITTHETASIPLHPGKYRRTG